MLSTIIPENPGSFLVDNFFLICNEGMKDSRLLVINGNI